MLALLEIDHINSAETYAILFLAVLSLNWGVWGGGAEGKGGRHKYYVTSSGLALVSFSLHGEFQMEKKPCSSVSRQQGMLPGELRWVRCDNYYKVSSTSAEQVRSKHTGMYVCMYVQTIHTTHAADISKKKVAGW